MSDFKYVPYKKDEFLSGFKDDIKAIAEECHSNAIVHGFDVSIKNDQLVALMSEMGEWCEAIRKGDLDNELEEVVDMLVRIFAYAKEHFPNDWLPALLQKMQYNKSRPWRHNGKAF
jgi:glycerol-3-phosphate cytidylyltransferase-like family protein